MRFALAACFALTVSAVLAGCATDSTTTDIPAPVQEPAWALKAIFGTDHPDITRVVGHDHTNRSLHVGLSTPNFQLLGHDNLTSPYFGQNAGENFCGDAAPHADRKLAVVTSLRSDVALTVLDVTDAAHPKMLSELVLPYVFSYDSSIFPDGRYAVIASNPDLQNDKMPLPPVKIPPVDGTATSAGAEGAHDQAPAASGDGPLVHRICNHNAGNEESTSIVDNTPYGYATLLVDLQDPTNPRVVDSFQYPAGRNVHSISATTIDGTRYVATSGLAAVPCTIPAVAGNPVPNPVPCEPQVPRYGNALSHYDFFTVTETPVGAKLQLLSAYTPTDQAHLDPSLMYLSNGHTDATIEKHPVTNKTVAYLADWDGGLHIVQINPPDPSSPQAASSWGVQALASWGSAPGDDPTNMRGNIHSVRPVEGLRDGRHYLLVGQEIVGRPTGRPSGQIVMLDVTVPNQPIQRARWTLPVDVQWAPSEGLLFSTHYPILVGDTLFVALYHGGVWAADASRANWPDLPSIGVFIPSIDAGPAFHGGLSPEVLEVLDLGDGNLLVYDGPTGAYTVHWNGASPEVPPAAPWAENPWIG